MPTPTVQSIGPVYRIRLDSVASRIYFFKIVSYLSYLVLRNSTVVCFRSALRGPDLDYRGVVLCGYERSRPSARGKAQQIRKENGFFSRNFVLTYQSVPGYGAEKATRHHCQDRLRTAIAAEPL